MKNKALLTLALAVVPALASAEITVTGGATLTYGKLDGAIGPNDVQEKGMAGRRKLDSGNGIIFGVQVGMIDMPVSGTPSSLEGEFIALDAAYRFANGMRVGAYADRLTMGCLLYTSRCV